MPRGHKSQGTMSTRSTRQQSTLSFNSKSSKVTKSSLSTPHSDKKAAGKLNKAAEEEILSHIDDANAEPQVANVELDDEVSRATVEEKGGADAQVTLQPASRKKRSRTSTGSTASSKAEQKTIDTAIEAADRITDAQIKKYWKAEDDARIAPRIHQSAISVHEKVLRHFDLSSQYGPCIGITRYNRWIRAQTLGLSPPLEVLSVLLKEQNNEKKGKTRNCGVMAYVDELMGGQVVAVE